MENHLSAINSSSRQAIVLIPIVASRHNPVPGDAVVGCSMGCLLPVPVRIILQSVSTGKTTIRIDDEAYTSVVLPNFLWRLRERGRPVEYGVKYCWAKASKVRKTNCQRRRHGVAQLIVIFRRLFLRSCGFELGRVSVHDKASLWCHKRVE